jgi:hypothetical protein
MTVAERPTIDQPLEYEIDPSVQDELLEHPGKWAALTRSEVLAIGDTIDEVMEAAEQMGHKGAILYRVPEVATSFFF